MGCEHNGKPASSPLAPRCHDCGQPPTHGVRCAKHAERHRLANIKRDRRKRAAEWVTAYAIRRCRLCKQPGHDRRLCSSSERKAA